MQCTPEELPVFFLSNENIILFYLQNIDKSENYCDSTCRGLQLKINNISIECVNDRNFWHPVKLYVFNTFNCNKEHERSVVECV